MSDRLKLKTMKLSRSYKMPLLRILIDLSILVLPKIIEKKSKEALCSKRSEICQKNISKMLKNQLGSPETHIKSLDLSIEAEILSIKRRPTLISMITSG